jgi:hypothetical protein
VGNVYVSDTSNRTIRKITSGGSVTTLAGSVGVAGSADGQGASASFTFPFGLAVDALSNVYVADTVNDNVRKITPNGTVSTYAGTTGVLGYTDGPGGSAGFANPEGIALAAHGEIYIADYANRTIRVIR